jgi:hypothetical protein
MAALSSENFRQIVKVYTTGGLSGLFTMGNIPDIPLRIHPLASSLMGFLRYSQLLGPGPERINISDQFILSLLSKRWGIVRLLVLPNKHHPVANPPG